MATVDWLAVGGYLAIGLVIGLYRCGGALPERHGSSGADLGPPRFVKFAPKGLLRLLVAKRNWRATRPSLTPT